MIIQNFYCVFGGDVRRTEGAFGEMRLSTVGDAHHQEKIMNISPLLIYDLIIFFVELLITISSLYAAWVNLVQKQITKAGFDAFILLFFNKSKAMMIRGNPRFIQRMGIITLLVGMGAVKPTISVFIEKIWPYFH